MTMIFILILIQFDINMDNDELLEITPNIRKKI
jgi:hypothetical protein